jgi:hypothetical protein
MRTRPARPLSSSLLEHTESLPLSTGTVQVSLPRESGAVTGDPKRRGQLPRKECQDRVGNQRCPLGGVSRVYPDVSHRGSGENTAIFGEGRKTSSTVQTRGSSTVTGNRYVRETLDLGERVWDYSPRVSRRKTLSEGPKRALKPGTATGIPRAFRSHPAPAGLHPVRPGNGSGQERRDTRERRDPLSRVTSTPPSKRGDGSEGQRA